MINSLEGIWNVVLEDGTTGEMKLPGTLDESGIGYEDVGANSWHPDADLGNASKKKEEQEPIATRFTRKVCYEGVARISKRICYIAKKGTRVFLEVERARQLELYIDGNKVEEYEPSSLNTPHCFEVTKYLTGDNEITFVSDNTYKEMPREGIVYSSTASDETQTNWNGLLGYVRLRRENETFIQGIQVYPKGKQIRVEVSISGTKEQTGLLYIRSEVLDKQVEQKIRITKGITKVTFEKLDIVPEVRLWDEYEGNLYQLVAEITDMDSKGVTFGVRDFEANKEGKLILNKRTIFVRSEANCNVFPETGHPPMTVEEWIKLLKIYKSYGVNCVRFHSNCPPEAAFEAADQIGMLMQPELSHWNPKDAFEEEYSYAYYKVELEQTLRMLANHPSFVMLTLGNELACKEEGHNHMNELLALAKQIDNTRLYANGSNVHYGAIGCDEVSDFYTSQKFYEEELRGTFAAENQSKQPGEMKKGRLQGYINNQYPNAKTNYDRTMEHLRREYKKPVFSFEVGQFEVLPYFEELTKFKHITDPVNYKLIQKKARELGLIENWNRYVEATGELALIGYREEVEAAMRTKELSGISLLGLQDFPGQGTALVGMLDSHFCTKPFAFARPERFQAFFREQLPLVLLEKYTYESEETLKAEIQIANYGKTSCSGDVVYELKGETIHIKGILCSGEFPAGRITSAGILELSLESVRKECKLVLTVGVGEIENTYPIWVYPKRELQCPSNVYETRVFDEKAKSVLKEGGRVYLSPDSNLESLPQSIQAQFTTDFWSVGTFMAQEGGMGQLIDVEHPIFQRFPTEFHTNWQWWAMASQRAIILPEPMKAIITEIDSYAYMRPMAQLLEVTCNGGTIVISSLGLHHLQEYPEARALQWAIYDYMESEQFYPLQEMSVEVVESLVK